MSPSVSVVIPSYNHAPFVAAAIQSVLDQSHSDLEIVVTDDGSIDGTPDVIRRFSDSRINLEVFERNRGASAALNSAIRRSRGEFICMLASDDCFLPGKLEKQVRFLRANEHIAASFGMPKFIDERGAPAVAGFNGDTFTLPFAKRLRFRQDWQRHFFFEGNCLLHPSAMMRRSALDEVGLFDPRLANLPDLDMWVRLCMTHEIHVMPDELTAMRILDHNRNMSAARRDSNIRTLIENFHILKHYRGLSREAIKEVFARDIADAQLDADGPLRPLLAELALLGEHPHHKMFALETMFEGTAISDGDHMRLIALDGSLDVFGIEAARAMPGLADQLDAARAKIAHLSDRIDAAARDLANTTAALKATRAEVEESQADVRRLTALLGTSHATHVRLNGELAEAQNRLAEARNQLAQLAASLQVIGGHVEAIRTRSRVYRLTRRLKGLRDRIDAIANEVARARR